MSDLTEKMDRIRKVVAGVNSAWAKENKVPPGTPDRCRIATDLPPQRLISMHNPAVDRALGGGMLQGTILNVTGQKGAGKTTLAADAVASCQAEGYLTVWYQTETDIPYEAWRLAGVDQKGLLYLDARGYGEDGLNLIKEIVMDGKTPRPEIGLIVIDSIAAMSPAAEMHQQEEKGFEGNTVGRHAAMTSKVLRVICGCGMLNGGATLLCINHKHAQISSSTPMPDVDSGGRAMGYYPKISLDLKAPKSGLIQDKNGTVVGHTVSFQVAKNNTGTARPYATGSYRVIYKVGLDKVFSLVDEGLDYGVVLESAARYQIRVRVDDGSYTLSPKVHGRDSFEAALKADPALLDKLGMYIVVGRSILRDGGARYIFMNGQYVDQATGECVDLADYILGLKVPPPIPEQIAPPISAAPAAELAAAA